jgi:fucose 4-O-acetylase-like acetyltransferase
MTSFSGTAVPPTTLATDTAAAIEIKAVRSGERVEWADYAKGMGIFLVVLGHALCGMSHASLSVPRGSMYALDWMYSFHMPLFFFLSGMFVLPALRKGIRRFVLHRIGNVLYCYVLWTVLNAAVRCTFSNYTNYRGEWSMVAEAWYKPIGELWFIYVLFFYYALCAALYALKVPPWGMLLLAIASLVMLQRHVFQFGASPVAEKGIAHFFYFALGAYVGKMPSLERGSAAVSSLLAAFCFALFSWGVYCEAYVGPLNVPLAMLGILATILLANALARSSKFRFIRNMGVATLAIYLAHTCFAAGWRILIQRVLGFDAPSIILVGGVTVGIAMPMLLQATLERLHFPYLFAFR